VIFDWMLELFRQCGILLFVSVSVIFDWMLKLFRQCGILLIVSVSVFFGWVLKLFPSNQKKTKTETIS
jgi:hypothetical protein